MKTITYNIPLKSNTPMYYTILAILRTGRRSGFHKKTREFLQELADKWGTDIEGVFERMKVTSEVPTITKSSAIKISTELKMKLAKMSLKTNRDMGDIANEILARGLPDFESDKYTTSFRSDVKLLSKRLDRPEKEIVAEIFEEVAKKYR